MGKIYKQVSPVDLLTTLMTESLVDSVRLNKLFFKCHELENVILKFAKSSKIYLK